MPDNLYTPALADTICKRIAEGESLRAICRDPGMPSEGTVRGWAGKTATALERVIVSPANCNWTTGPT